MTDAATLPELINQRAADRGAHPAIVLPDEVLTYTALQERSDHIARGLMGLGVQPGDRVGYFLPEGRHSLPVLFGMLKAGATAVPVNNRFKAFELGRVLTQVELRALITAAPETDAAADLIGLLAEVLPGLAPIEHVVRLDDQATDGFVSRADFAAAAAGISTAALRAREAGVDPAQVAVIKYTSGTTGTPKGAMLSHRAMLGAASGTATTHLRLADDDVVWSALPLFHIGGVAFAVSCFSAGATFVHPGYFDPEVAIGQIIDHRATVAMPAFETIWLPVVEHPRWAEVQTLRLVECTGTERMLRNLQSRHPQAPLVSCFGMTEACGFLSLCLPDDPLDTRINTGGFPLPGMEAKIVDPESGARLPPESPGEICFRGPNTFDGYYADAELNAKVFDAEGYFHTGDMGVMDAEGRVTFRNRLKDMLKVGGENVAAAEVEDYLITHPAVHLVQVVAAPDARYAEVPAAFVQLKPDAAASEQEIIDFCRGNIATFRVPRYVRFVEEWPMSGTKIQKFALRERIAAELEAAGIREAPKLSSS